MKDRLFDGRRSVILSAGAIMSPMILFNSGVGPGHLLKEANIPVVVNNDNIGSGLRNHVTVGLAYQMQPQLRAGISLHTIVYSSID
jgi:choline dehydrogenase-like flavoprotein